MVHIAGTIQRLGMDKYVIFNVRSTGEDLVWSNTDGWVGWDSTNPELLFDESDRYNLHLPIDGGWCTMGEIEEVVEARGCLEGLPCPICTQEISTASLITLLSEIQQLAIDIYSHPVDHSNEDEDTLWWTELENGSLTIGGKYYD